MEVRDETVHEWLDQNSLDSGLVGVTTELPIFSLNTVLTKQNVFE